MNAEIISIGTELLLGQVVNTDAVFIARELSAIGINLLHSCVVGDNQKRLEEVLKEALKRSDLVITTGGLGPTEDDLTKEIIAKVTRRNLVLDLDSWKRIEQYLNSKKYGESQRKQAYLPEGGFTLKNDCGIAPGSILETKEGKLVIMLPGPPSELNPMFRNYAIPYLLQKKQAIILSVNIRVFGIGEGPVAEQLKDITGQTNPTVATYAKDAEMFIRVTAKAKDLQTAKAMNEVIMHEIQKRLGDLIYTTELDSLEDLVVQLLQDNKMKIATAESCTGGLLAKRLTDISGASQVFEMGIVTYANRTKTKFLGIPENLLMEQGSVCAEVAKEMAESIRTEADSSLGIGITGIAGPDGGSPEKPIGLTYIALSDGRTIYIRKMNSIGQVRGREYLRTLTASNALDMVRRYLLGYVLLEEERYEV